MGNTVEILVGADVVPTANNKDLFASGNIEAVVCPLLSATLEKADFRVFNLETPLVESFDPINKCGPHLDAPAACVNGIKKLNPDLLTLANNHIMDHGCSGLETTEKSLLEKNIRYIGVGKKRNAVKDSYVFEKNGLKIAFYVCCEHEFSIAQKDYPGANPFDPFDSLDRILELKKDNNYVVVLYHGGKEYYQYPSPDLQRCFRRMADKGADVVIAQHTHCIGCRENYRDSVFVYGQGNFLFDDGDDVLGKNSLLLKLLVSPEKIDVCEIVIEKTKTGTKLADESTSRKVLDDYMTRSLNVQNMDFVEKEYRRFAEESLGFYLRQMKGNPIWLKILAKIFGNRISTKFYNKKTLLDILNYVECEAHRELLLKGLKG